MPDFNEINKQKELVQYSRACKIAEMFLRDGKVPDKESAKAAVREAARRPTGEAGERKSRGWFGVGTRVEVHGVTGAGGGKEIGAELNGAAGTVTDDPSNWGQNLPPAPGERWTVEFDEIYGTLKLFLHNLRLSKIPRKGEECPYTILGLPKDADDEAVQKKYRSLSLKFHPDRPGGSEAKMAQISDALERLKKMQEDDKEWTDKGWVKDKEGKWRKDLKLAKEAEERKAAEKRKKEKEELLAAAEAKKAAAKEAAANVDPKVEEMRKKAQAMVAAMKAKETAAKEKAAAGKPY